jgi:hypothetical protein
MIEIHLSNRYNAAKLINLLEELGLKDAMLQVGGGTITFSDKRQYRAVTARSARSLQEEKESSEQPADSSGDEVIQRGTIQYLGAELALGDVRRTRPSGGLATHVWRYIGSGKWECVHTDPVHLAQGISIELEPNETIDLSDRPTMPFDGVVIPSE